MAARVLVIEDNADNMELMTYLLQAFGHAVLQAHDGGEGLQIAKCQPLDLILCDIHLPAMDGYEVARLLKANPAFVDVPLIGVTALAMVGDRERILGAGFDGYISKPIEPETFVTQIERFLKKEQRSLASNTTTTTANSVPPLATILIVDDSPPNLQVFRDTLQPSGYAVIEATSIRDGLALARQRVPDLIVSDLHLHEESGFDFLKAVKADDALRSIPFLYLSSTALRTVDQQHGLDLGAVRFLIRPIEPQTLLDEIAACLRERKKA